MTIRNGSTKDTDADPQQPTPLTSGQYPASTAMTATSIGLAIVGAAAFSYSLATGCSFAGATTGIVLTLASAVVEGINLALGRRRALDARELGGARLARALPAGGQGKKLLRPGEEWKITFGPNTRVVFCDPKTGLEQAASPLINDPNAVVELKEVPGLTLASGDPVFYTQVT